MATYVAGKDSTATINGTAMAVEKASYECTITEDEVTNLNSGGFYDAVSTIKKATASIMCIYDGDEPPDFDEGDTIALVLAVPGGPGLTGNFIVTKMSYPIVDPKAAVKYSLDVSSRGPYTKSGGAP